MDIGIYQDALVSIEAFGQNFNTTLQTAVETWTEGLNLFGDNNAEVEGGAEVDGLSSEIAADAETEASTDEGGLELDLETELDTNL